jgi:hypothetical protein
MKTRLELDMHRQPDDASCGPTCLHAVYRYFDDEVDLDRLISEVVPLETGGTLAVLLAMHALRRGYSATIYTYNLQLFDPTWFRPGVSLAEQLEKQAAAKDDGTLRFATQAYLEYLAMGGRVRFEELGPGLIRRLLSRRIPILTGLSATYLYETARESGVGELEYDDIRGRPTGHFVVLCGYDPNRNEVLVADPLGDHPRFGSHPYPVGMQRLLGAILLGVLTYDANLLILQPPDQSEGLRLPDLAEESIS